METSDIKRFLAAEPMAREGKSQVPHGLPFHLLHCARCFCQSITTATPIIEALRSIGYEGYLSAEILPLPDSDAAALSLVS